MIRVPQRLRSSEKSAAWLNALRDAVASLVPVHSPDSLTAHTTRGTVKRSFGGKSTTSTGGVGLRLRGEYRSDTAYATGDLVVIAAGPAGGAYVSLEDNAPGTDPSAGGTWFQIGGPVNYQLWM